MTQHDEPITLERLIELYANARCQEFNTAMDETRRELIARGVPDDVIEDGYRRALNSFGKLVLGRAQTIYACLQDILPHRHRNLH